MNITIVAGAPGTGKTFLVDRTIGFDFLLRINSDDYKDVPWEAQSVILATLIKEKAKYCSGTIVVEGLCALRGLRKAIDFGWITSEDTVTVFMMKSIRSVSRYDERQAKAQQTILTSVLEKLPTVVVYDLIEGNPQ